VHANIGNGGRFGAGTASGVSGLTAWGYDGSRSVFSNSRSGDTGGLSLGHSGGRPLMSVLAHSPTPAPGFYSFAEDAVDPDHSMSIRTMAVSPSFAVGKSKRGNPAGWETGGRHAKLHPQDSSFKPLAQSPKRQPTAGREKFGDFLVLKMPGCSVLPLEGPGPGQMTEARDFNTTHSSMYMSKSPTTAFGNSARPVNRPINFERGLYDMDTSRVPCEYGASTSLGTSMSSTKPNTPAFTMRARVRYGANTTSPANSSSAGTYRRPLGGGLLDVE
jgi:hypothetical protein